MFTFICHPCVKCVGVNQCYVFVILTDNSTILFQLSILNMIYVVYKTL